MSTSCPFFNIRELKDALDGLNLNPSESNKACVLPKGGQHGGVVGPIGVALGLVAGALVAVHPDHAGQVLGTLAYGGCNMYKMLGTGSGIKSLESYDPSEVSKGTSCEGLGILVQTVARNAFTGVQYYDSFKEIVDLLGKKKYELARTKMTNFTEEYEPPNNETTPKPSPWTPFIQPVTPDGFPPPKFVRVDKSYPDNYSPPPPPPPPNNNAFVGNNGNNAHRGEENHTRIPLAGYVGRFPLVAAALVLAARKGRVGTPLGKPGSKRSPPPTTFNQTFDPFKISYSTSNIRISNNAIPKFSFYGSDEQKDGTPSTIFTNPFKISTNNFSFYNPQNGSDEQKYNPQNGSDKQNVSSTSYTVKKLTPAKLTNAEINQKIKNNARKYKKEKEALRSPPVESNTESNIESNEIPDFLSNFGRPKLGGKRRTKRRSIMQKKRTRRHCRSRK